MKEKYEFIRNYIRAYDHGITAQNIFASFGICAANSLYGEIYAYHGQMDVRHENILIAKAVLNQLSYNCCITFHDKLTAAEYNKLKSDKTRRIKVPNEANMFYLHVCDSVPVMIGSVLDRYLSRFYRMCELTIEIADLRALMLDDVHNVNIKREPGSEADFFGVSEKPLFGGGGSDYSDIFTSVFTLPIRSKIAGYFFINGDIVAIPYLMDNNRENIHLYKDRLFREYWRFFLYSVTNRGYKMCYDLANDSFVSRDCHGVDYSEAIPFVDLKREFDISPKHVLWNFQWFKWLLKSFITFKFEIDTLYNKLVLSPINIIMRAIILMRKRPSEALGIIKTGNFARLLSTTTRFSVKTDKPFSNFIRSINNSNFLRHPNSNQIEDWLLLSQVVKPSQEQVKLNKKIPDNFNGFICPYDLNANIKNFAKFFNIVYDVQCYQPTFDNVLDDLLEQLLTLGILVRTYEAQTLPGEVFAGNVKSGMTINTLPLLLNGTLPTPYTVRGTIENLYRNVKRINPWVEVRELNQFVSLNCFAGLPMKPFGDYFVSPYELNTFEKSYMKSGLMPQVSLIGQLFLKYHKLALHDRSVGSASYYKSSLTSHNNVYTCTFSNEVVSTYLSTCKSNLPHFIDDFNEKGVPIKHTRALDLVDGNFIPLKVGFCASLYTNEDGYSINEQLNFNVVITKKMNYDFLPSKDLQIILADTDSCAQYLYNPSSGEREELLIKICTIYTTDEIEPSHYTKITCLKRDEHIYDFYKTLDSRDILQLRSERDIDFNIEVRYSNEKAQILLEMVYRVPYYDGLKLCNLSAQKGLGAFHDLSQYRNERGEQPDVLMSLFGIIGRCPLSQLQEMANNEEVGAEKLYFYDETGQRADCGWMSTCNFFICKNVASIIRMAGGMKVDHLTNSCFIMNNLSLSLYSKIQDRYKPDDRFKLFPREHMDVLELYALQKTHIQCVSDAVEDSIPMLLPPPQPEVRPSTLRKHKLKAKAAKKPAKRAKKSNSVGSEAAAPEELPSTSAGTGVDPAGSAICVAPEEPPAVDDDADCNQRDIEMDDPISIKNRQQVQIYKQIFDIIHKLEANKKTAAK